MTSVADLKGLETMEVLRKHINGGTWIAEPAVSLVNLMRYLDAEKYTRFFLNRLLHKDLIDIKHIFPSDGGIEMDIIGLEKCREIIVSYVGDGKYKQAFDAIQDMREYVTWCNNMLYYIRKSTDHFKRYPKDAEFLAELITENAKNEKRQGVKWFRHIKNSCELAWHGIKKLPMRLQLSPRTVVKIAAAAFKIEGKYLPLYDGGSFYMALKRFKARNPSYIKPERLNRDKLKKFVYLGVKAFGKEYQKHCMHSNTHDCREIEWLHGETSLIMKAVGLLTPDELMQMFPIRKEYDGDRFGCKDYFWTMGKIKALPPNRPIGSELDAAVLLWDYVNWDTEFFFLKWEGCLMDLNTYCCNEQPWESFSKRLMERSDK